MRGGEAGSERAVGMPSARQATGRGRVGEKGRGGGTTRTALTASQHGTPHGTPGGTKHTTE